MFGGFFDRFKKGLAKTRALFGGVAELFRWRGKVDQKFLDELEKRLYLADVGKVATEQILTRVRQAFLDKEITGDVAAFVKAELRGLLADDSPGLNVASGTGPYVILVA